MEHDNTLLTPEERAEVERIEGLDPEELLAFIRTVRRALAVPSCGRDEALRILEART